MPKKTRHAATAEDVRILKSVEPHEFAAGGMARYTVEVDVSEYVEASDVVLTDTLPDGYCPGWEQPKLRARGARRVRPAGGATPTPRRLPWCSTPALAHMPITFEALNLVGANGSATPAGHGPGPDAQRVLRLPVGAQRRDPRPAAKLLVNRASLSATATTAIEGTDPLPNGDDNGPLDTVTDDSSATQGTASPTIDKTMKPRRETVDCATTAAPAYTNPPSPAHRPDWTSAAVTLPASDSV